MWVGHVDLKCHIFRTLVWLYQIMLRGPIKISKSPILGKSKYDPYFVATCFVVKKKRFEMYYTSNLLWQKIKGSAQPKYLVKKAYSKNGIDWISKNEKVINFTNKNETAITRPWIIKIKNKTFMFYSVKKKYYKIKTSFYKKNKWIRKKIFEFENKNLKFDNISQEYSSLIKFKNNIYMFYNGNDYGKQGIGLAIAKLNEKKIKDNYIKKNFNSFEEGNKLILNFIKKVKK